MFFTSSDFISFEGCGFVKLSNRDMAVAAINALNGNYVMRVKPIIIFMCIATWVSASAPNYFLFLVD